MKDKHWTLLVWTLILAGLGLAWTFRHPEDDAFITFRYSQHLAEGIGPVWNAGQHVEGYTNFLWMLVMALPIAAGFDPVFPSYLISFAFLAGNLWLLYRMSVRQTEGTVLGFWAWLPVAFSHTLFISATSGLETAMNGFLWTFVLWQLQRVFLANRIPTAKSLWMLGLSCGLAALSRPEAGLLVVACVAGLVVWLYIARHSIWTKLWHFCASFLLLTLPWLIWKVLYYGSMVPNTFFVKVNGSGQWLGFQFVLLFLLVSGCWIPELVITFSSMRRKWIFDLFLICLAGLTAAFLAYVVLAGGDYLEFRLLVPILPFVMMQPLWRLARKSQHLKQMIIPSLLMVVMAIAWGQGHGRLFRIWYLNPMVHVTEPDAKFMSFEAQGKALGKLLDNDPTIRLAIGACGAIPYYTGFYGIDLYELNEPKATFNAYETGYGPGHKRLAEFAYIQSQKAHLISLRCDYLGDSPGQRVFDANERTIAEVTHGATRSALENLRILDLPLGNGFVEVCIYLNPHPTIDRVIKSNSLKIYPLANF